MTSKSAADDAAFVHSEARTIFFDDIFSNGVLVETLKGRTESFVTIPSGSTGRRKGLETYGVKAVLFTATRPTTDT